MSNTDGTIDRRMVVSAVVAFVFVLAMMPHAVDGHDKAVFHVGVMVRNEETRLRKFMQHESMQQLLNHKLCRVFVFDSGSTDDTMSVASLYGATVMRLDLNHEVTITKQVANEFNEFMDPSKNARIINEGDKYFNFGAARQNVNRLLRSQFSGGRVPFLMLDVGDIIETLDINAIASYVQSGFNRFSYKHYLSPEGHTDYQWIIRFYAPYNSRWLGATHEALYSVDQRVNSVKELMLDPAILSVRNAMRHQSARNYIPGLVRSCIELPTYARWIHYLGRELFYHGQCELAIPLLMKHALRDDAFNSERASSLEHIGRCYVGQKRYIEAMGSYAMAGLFDNNRFTPWVEQAWIAYILNNFESCISLAKIAQRIPPGRSTLQDLQTLASSYHVHYICLLKLGQIKEARDSWMTARDLQPNNLTFMKDVVFFNDH
jgi:tetratricopeptide (TPR) repeat protein